MDMEDSELLREFAERGSDAAFTTLVQRYADLVYSTALRQLRDPDLSQEVAQTVFCLLARKARSLCNRTALVGWFYRAACFAAADVLRTERRRRERERKAAQMEIQATDTDTAWEQLSPLLDEAINQLGEKDRLAVLLRFFQRKPMREVGQALGISEDAAKMRVARSVEKLRGFFAKKGVACPAGIIAAVLSEKAIQAAPIGFAQSLGAAAKIKAAGAVTFSSLIINTLKFMAKLNMKTVTVAGIGLLVALNIGLYVSNRSPRQVLKKTSGQVNSRKTLATTGSIDASQPNAGKLGSAATDPAIAVALENLRAVVREPWKTRRRPDQKIRDALAQLGSDRKAAVPVLLEILKTGSDQALWNASFALQQLGPDAREALPGFIELLRTNPNRLGRLDDDDIQKLFTALHPGVELIPDLMDMMRQPEPGAAQPTPAPRWGRGGVAGLIATVVQNNPGSEAIYRNDLAAFLQDAHPDVRFSTACALTRFPGLKETGVISELINALKVDALRDPHYYEPVFDPTYRRDLDQYRDDFRRSQAVNGLKACGQDAKSAVAALEELAGNTSNSELRKSALAAIGTIDPEKRLATPEIDQILTARETGQSLVQKIGTGQASFEDLLQGLRYPESVSAASQAIAKLEPEAIARALPSLRSALTTLGDHDPLGAYDTIQVIKQSDPQFLVVALKTPHDAAAYDAADALGDLGTEARFALPALYEAIERDSWGTQRAIESAIKRIDPNAPKLLFTYGDDLQLAENALMEAANTAEGELRRRIENVYEKHAYGENRGLRNMTRSEVIAFARAVREVDQRAYNLFVTKLVEDNPSLADALKPAE